ASAATLAQTPRIELTPAVLERIVSSVYFNKHVLSAQELGWYALDFNQPRTAIAWFDTALGWDPANEPAAFGIVVASDQLGDDARIAAIKAQWSGRSRRIADYGTPAAQDEARTTPPAAPETRAAAPTPAPAPVR